MTVGAEQQVREFIAEACETSGCFEIVISELYTAYVDWCGDARPLGKPIFGRVMGVLGYEADRTGSERYRRGLRLCRDAAPEASTKIPDVSVFQNGLPTPPNHLAPSTASWWRSVVEENDLDEHHLRLLTLAAEAWDRVQMARKAISVNGLTMENGRGVEVRRPEIDIEHKASTLFARHLRELGLDDGPTDDVRIPRRPVRK